MDFKPLVPFPDLRDSDTQNHKRDVQSIFQMSLGNHFKRASFNEKNYKTHLYSEMLEISDLEYCGISSRNHNILHVLGKLYFSQLKLFSHLDPVKTEQ